jgi:hypothetical protein
MELNRLIGYLDKVPCTCFNGPYIYLQKLCPTHGSKEDISSYKKQLKNFMDNKKALNT